MRHMLVLVVVAGGLLAPSPGGADERTLHALEDYAILARDTVKIGAGSTVESGHVGAISGSIELGRNAYVNGNVAADTVELDRGARAATVNCRFIQATDATSCTPLDLPVADLNNLRLAQPPLGAVDIDVPRRTRSAPVASGEFGSVTVNGSADLMLEGGAYAFRTLTVHPRGKVVCRSKCAIRVQDAVLLRQRAALVPGTGLDARAVRLDLEGSGKVFTARPLTVVQATVYAPQGTVFLGRRGKFEGAFVGRSVVTGTSAKVRLNSGL